MRKIVILALVAMLSLAASGCGTAYRTAMDQREYSQQKEDFLIEAEIKKRFLQDDVVEVLDFGVFSYLGRVYLLGEYEIMGQVDRAVEVARKVEGVRSVITYVLPEKDDPECGWTDNVALEAKVKKNLIADEDISATNIEVESLQCNVVLLGLVAYQQIIPQAVRHAKAVEGVRSVRSYLRVME